VVAAGLEETVASVLFMGGSIIAEGSRSESSSLIGVGPRRGRLRAPGYTDKELEELLGEEPSEEDA
jgi:hypothetical protein